MQKVAKYLLLVLACVPPMVVHAQAQTEMDMGKTVGELVRLEAAKALSELRRSAPPPELPPMPAKLQAPAANASSKPRNTDLVELLGTYKRGDQFSADLAINGVVSYVSKGDKVGAYVVKAIANNCAYIIDPTKVELLRCVAVAQ
ncbi:MAG: hypothetical protein Q7T63_11485 [Burkholderiaceae bacterium]|nr:hypothetical protein [Burkholderiaceae bacterium]MDP3135893.1 hypothetical protein [Burkholderiaceae bacterium]